MALLIPGGAEASPASVVRHVDWPRATLFLLALVPALLLFVAPVRRYLRSAFDLTAGERVLFLGAGALARKLAALIDSTSPGSVVGFLLENDPERSPSVSMPLPYPSIGTIHDLPEVIAATRPDRIVVAMAERRNALPIPDLLACRANGIIVEGGTEAYERMKGKLAIESLTPSSLLFSGSFHRHPFQDAMMRVVSVTVAAIGLVLAAPLMVAVAVAIKLDSSGPVLFVQERVGWRERRFRLWKFRTMLHTDTPVSEWVADNADRITRVGKWIRKFRLDELPQFVNILRGDMDLVGPRPHPVSNYELFAKSIPFYVLRASVRPGLTGWAQVRNGYANNLDEETEKMRYDLYYIKNRSLWLDLRIIAATVKVVVVGEKDGHPAVEAAAAVSYGVEAHARQDSLRPVVMTTPISRDRFVELSPQSKHHPA